VIFRHIEVEYLGLASVSDRTLVPLLLARTLLTQQGRDPLPLPPLPDCAPWHCPRCGKAMRVTQRFTAAQLYFAGFDSS